MHGHGETSTTRTNGQLQKRSVQTGLKNISIHFFNKTIYRVQPENQPPNKPLQFLLDMIILW